MQGTGQRDNLFAAQATYNGRSDDETVESGALLFAEMLAVGQIDGLMGRIAENESDAIPWCHREIGR